jgi:hypothetical protein
VIEGYEFDMIPSRIQSPTLITAYFTRAIEGDYAWLSFAFPVFLIGSVT